MIVAHIIFGIGVYYLWDPSWFLYTIAGVYVLGILGLEVYLHRYVTHQAFKMNRKTEVFLHFLAILNLQGSFTLWASTHGTHHKYSDTEKDPHPSYDFFGTWLWLRPFKKGHSVKPDVKIIRRCLDNKLMQFTDKNFFIIYWLSIGIISLISMKFVVYVLLLSAIVNFHIISVFTNIVAHRYGSVDHVTGDNSRNALWLIPLAGSPFHNTHHAYPGHYTCSTKWYEIDPAGLIIKYLISSEPVKEIPK
jgi:stearoyl-CoA desaturase (delta-9 desaturase)